MRPGTVPYGHMLRLTDGTGIFEHAEGSVPRRHLGYCLDDVARALVVVSREPAPSPALHEAGRSYLRFVESAQAVDGACHNRLGQDGRWQDQPSLGDWWGRALWGLGTAAARFDDDLVRKTAAESFARSATCRSPFPRAMAFAALGAAEVLAVRPDDVEAQDLLAALPAAIGGSDASSTWPWPEPRLGYANAALAEALLAVGEHLDDGASLERGLSLLSWLLSVETAGDHLSVVPTGGWAPGEARPGFDQQPIEVAALADACARAVRLTGATRFAEGLASAVHWFEGDNDTGTAMWDPATGGGFDGLESTGRNANQGAESTLAMVATFQHGRSIGPS